MAYKNIGQVKRYRMISPETYNRLLKPQTNENNNKQTIIDGGRSRSRSPEISNWEDVLIMLPINYRKNTRIIMSYLGHLSDSLFYIVPGSMEILIDDQIIQGSNFVELVHALHNNFLNPSLYPVGIDRFLYLLALGTPVPVFTIQNVKLRKIVDSIRKNL